MDAFSNCQQAYAAEELFDAYRKTDAEAVKACVARNSVFTDLDTQVSSCLAPCWPAAACACHAQQPFAVCQDSGIPPCPDDLPWRPQIGRLAKQLPQGSVATQAAELGAAPNAGGVTAADLDEDDLT